MAVDPQADFTVDRADVVEVPFWGWLGEVSFGVASRSVWRKGREGGEFRAAHGEDISMGGKPGRFLARAFFVLLGIAGVEDLDLDPRIGETVRREAFEGVVWSPEEEARVSCIGQVSPPADEFEVSVLLFRAKDADRFAGAVDQWTVPGPSFFVAVGALEIVFSEFDPTVAGGIDLDGSEFGTLIRDHRFTLGFLRLGSPKSYCEQRAACGK